MTLTTLAIHAEAWLQEELGAQQALLATLGRLERAARAGSAAELEGGGTELAGLLAPADAREARRRALLARMGAALGADRATVTLSAFTARLAASGIDGERLERLRRELRSTVADVLKVTRRLVAVARYHGGLLDELCRLLTAGAGGAGQLVDARG
jgi:hypothetical protein